MTRGETLNEEGTEAAGMWKTEVEVAGMERTKEGTEAEMGKIETDVGTIEAEVAVMVKTGEAGGAGRWTTGGRIETGRETGTEIGRGTKEGVVFGS